MERISLLACTKVKYSERERQLLDLVPRNGDKISTHELMARFYGAQPIPFHGRAIIGVMMRQLVRKAEYNGELWHIRRTPRSGPKPISYWLEGQ